MYHDKQNIVDDCFCFCIILSIVYNICKVNFKNLHWRLILCFLIFPLNTIVYKDLSQLLLYCIVFICFIQYIRSHLYTIKYIINIFIYKVVISVCMYVYLFVCLSVCLFVCCRITVNVSSKLLWNSWDWIKIYKDKKQRSLKENNDKMYS